MFLRALNQNLVRLQPSSFVINTASVFCVVSACSYYNQKGKQDSATQLQYGQRSCWTWRHKDMSAGATRTGASGAYHSGNCGAVTLWVLGQCLFKDMLTTPRTSAQARDLML